METPNYFKKICYAVFLIAFAISISTCKKSEDSSTTITTPVLTTTSPSSITETSAVVGGFISADGGAAVSERGVCYSTNENPTYADLTVIEGGGTGNFQCTLTGLHSNTKYYVKAYATNSAGTAYGYEVSFTTLTSVTLATVTTSPATSITQTTASSGGNVTSDGGITVTIRGVCWSISSNPTIADSHTTDGSGTGIFVSALTGLTLNTVYHVRAYATNSTGTAYGSDLNFSTSSAFTCGTSIIVNHVAGNVAPVTKTVTYGTVTDIPGETSKCWITSNLGADHQATSVSDATEASAGWYWQFNRKQGYMHDGTARTPNTTWINTISENSDWTTVNDPCSIELGTGWRIPTNTEWTNVDVSGGWTDWNGPWNSGLKMHAAGYLGVGGSLYYRGSSGIYRSSSQSSATHTWILGFGSGNSGIYTNVKADGYPLRCLKDN
ncbi:MAG: hypothetical protein ACOYM0_08615 [Bacteroidales bacterium]